MDRCFDGDYYAEEAASAQRRTLYYVTALGSASIEHCLTATTMDRCFDGDYYVEEAASAQR